MPQITPHQDFFQSLAAANLTAGTNTLIPAGFTPTVDLMLNYGQEQVMGNLFPTAQCTNPPNINFFSEDPAKFSLSYTLILADPDAPMPQAPLNADWCHWILPGLMPINFNEIITSLSNDTDSNPSSYGKSEKSNAVTQTRKAIVPYYPPSPDANSGPHRYIFLLYREPYPIPESYLALKAEDLGISNNPQTRKNFNTSHFVETYNLTLVGVNWFRGVNAARLNNSV